MKRFLLGLWIPVLLFFGVVHAQEVESVSMRVDPVLISEDMQFHVGRTCFCRLEQTTKTQLDGVRWATSIFPTDYDSASDARDDLLAFLESIHEVPGGMNLTQSDTFRDFINKVTLGFREVQWFPMNEVGSVKIIDMDDTLDSFTFLYNVACIVYSAVESIDATDKALVLRILAEHGLNTAITVIVTDIEPGDIVEVLAQFRD